ncbi:DUF4230 domain-containing protein [Kitasatospora sp. NPDC101157]|uniref:DUF4230 domain-containing protein n=1 Tax=Kitasatospora sp. NPDC101157 TaxID=3364098 RepID=UPI00382BA425
MALDPKQFHIYSQERGLFDRFGDFFSGNPGNQQQVEQPASQRIQNAAQSSGPLQHAEQNTRDALRQLLSSLGFTTVDERVG